MRRNPERYFDSLSSSTRRKTRSLRKPPKPRSPWPHIEELIESAGNITIGRVASIDCAAIATDEHNMLAALVRRKGETFLDLMRRLDEAVQLALEEEQFTDEING